MQLDSEIATLDAPPVLLGALSEAKLSKSSLLASVLLHILVVAVALWASGRTHRPEHPVFLVNLKGGVSATRGPKTDPSTRAEKPLRPTEVPSEVLPAKVIPSEAAVAEAAEPSTAAAPAPAEEAQQQAGADVPAVTEPGPAVAPPETWNEAQMRYRAAIAQRVREVTLPWAIRSNNAFFQGWISFHMCIDATGRLKHAPVLLEDEPGRKHMNLVPTPMALKLAPPNQMQQYLQWHFEGMVGKIRAALEKAQPYPTPGPDVVIPENMAFPIELNVLEPMPEPDSSDP